MGKIPSSPSFASKDSEYERWECQGASPLLFRPHDRRETRPDPVLAAAPAATSASGPWTHDGRLGRTWAPEGSHFTQGS